MSGGDVLRFTYAQGMRHTEDTAQVYSNNSHNDGSVSSAYTWAAAAESASFDMMEELATGMSISANIARLSLSLPRYACVLCARICLCLSLC